MHTGSLAADGVQTFGGIRIGAVTPEELRSRECNLIRKPKSSSLGVHLKRNDGRVIASCFRGGKNQCVD